jgi:WD40 repeat protein
MPDRSKTIIEPIQSVEPPAPTAPHDSRRNVNGPESNTSDSPSGSLASARRRRKQLVWAIATILLAGPASIVLWFAWSFSQDAGAADSNELARFTRHEKAVCNAAISADGEVVLSADEGGTLRVWRLDNRHETGQLQLPDDCNRIVAMSPDAKLAATAGSSSGARIWDLERFEETASLNEPAKTVTCLAFNPAGTHLLTGGREGNSLLWDLNTKKVVRSFGAKKAELRALTFLPGGKKFLAADSVGELCLWDLAKELQLASVQAHTDGVVAIAVDAAGKRAASCGRDGTIRVWNVQNLTPLDTFPSPAEDRKAVTVALSPGGTRVLSGNRDGSLRLLSCESHELVETFFGNESTVRCCLIVPNDLTAVSGGDDAALRLWRLPSASAFELKQVADAVDLAANYRAQLQRYEGRMRLGQTALDDDELKVALTEFRAAEAAVDSDSLEFSVAHDAAQQVEEAQQKIEQYRANCESGKEALEREDFQEAQRKFQFAKQLYPDRHEAREGFDAATEGERIKVALEKATFEKRLEFAKPLAWPVNLRNLRRTAFLLTQQDPTMAEATSNLTWTIETELTIEWPEKPATLRVVLSKEGDEQPVAAVDHPFVSGQRRQVFVGEAKPPTTGWESGRYKIETSLLGPKGEINRSKPQSFEMGVIRWTKKQLHLTPSGVLEAGFSVDSGLKVKVGDALCVHASGTMTPAPIDFYRDLLSDPKLVEPMASTPVGISWTTNDQMLRKYRPVEITANFAALLVKCGGRAWVPYEAIPHPFPAPHAGSLRLSLNSLLPPRSIDTTQAASRLSRTYWRSDSGKYDVMLFQGRFDFPSPLSTLERAGLLDRFVP